VGYATVADSYRYDTVSIPLAHRERAYEARTPPRPG
jgi:hypothetical protein